MKNRIIYNYNVGATNHLMVESSPRGFESNQINFKLTWLSKFMWGLGAAGNSVYNAFAPVKFQSDKDTNIRRARLLVKLYRYCVKNNIDIMKLPENTKKDRFTNPDPEDFDYWVNKILKDHAI